MKIGYKLKGVLLVAIASIAWGAMPVFTRFLYHEGWSTNTVLFLRYLIALFFLSIYIIYKKINLRLSLKQYLFALLIGIPGYLATSFFLYLSYHYIPIGLATMLHFIYPLLVVIMMIIFYREKLNLIRFSAIALSFAGIWLLMGGPFNGASTKGMVLALLSGFTYAFYVTGLSHSRLRNIHPISLTFHFMLMSVVLILLPIIVQHDFHFQVNSISIISILFIAIFATVISFLCFLEGIKRIGSSDSALLNTLEPIISIIAGILIFNESLTISIFLGCLMVVFAIFILSRNI